MMARLSIEQIKERINNIELSYPKSMMSMDYTHEDKMYLGRLYNLLRKAEGKS